MARCGAQDSACLHGCGASLDWCDAHLVHTNWSNFDPMVHDEFKCASFHGWVALGPGVGWCGPRWGRLTPLWTQLAPIFVHFVSKIEYATKFCGTLLVKIKWCIWFSFTSRIEKYSWSKYSILLHYLQRHFHSWIGLPAFEFCNLHNHYHRCRCACHLCKALFPTCETSFYSTAYV
jgi:hypothetical protein